MVFSPSVDYVDYNQSSLLLFFLAAILAKLNIKHYYETVTVPVAAKAPSLVVMVIITRNVYVFL